MPLLVGQSPLYLSQAAAQGLRHSREREGKGQLSRHRECSLAPHGPLDATATHHAAVTTGTWPARAGTVSGEEFRCPASARPLDPLRRPWSCCSNLRGTPGKPGVVRGLPRVTLSFLTRCAGPSGTALSSTGGNQVGPPCTLRPLGGSTVPCLHLLGGPPQVTGGTSSDLADLNGVVGEE